MTKKILITGAAGFIGSWLGEYFSRKHFVIGIDDLSTGRQTMETLDDYAVADLTNLEQVMSLPDVDVVLHFAGQSSGERSLDQPVEDAEKNYLSTVALAHRYRSTHTRIIHASSMAIYGEPGNKAVSELDFPQPISPYGLSKLSAERILQMDEFQLDATSLRLSNVYGPGQDLQRMNQGMVSIYLNYALTSNVIEVKGDLERIRDFIYVGDVVKIVEKAVELSGHQYPTINVGSGQPFSVRELLNSISMLVGDREIRVLPRTQGDQSVIYPDISKLRTIVNASEFTSLDMGLREFVNTASEVLGGEGH